MENKPKPQFVAYIDEAGDEGFKFLPGEKGSSRWFVLSALVVRVRNDAAIVAAGREARTLLNKPANMPLHFRNLRHEHRVPLARLIGGLQARTVSVLIHKPSIASPEHFQREAFSMFRYAARLLLERISWLCRDNRDKSLGPAYACELIFSNRSAMSYEDLRGYIALLFAQSANLSDVRIDWGAIDERLVRAVNHDQLAGLQLADAVASGMYYSVNKSQYGETEPRYAKLMAPILYRSGAKANGYGVKLWCSDAAATEGLLAAISSK